MFTPSETITGMLIQVGCHNFMGCGSEDVLLIFMFGFFWVIPIDLSKLNSDWAETMHIVHV